MILTFGFTARAAPSTFLRLISTISLSRYCFQLMEPFAAAHSEHSQSVKKKSSIMISLNRPAA